MKLIYKERSCGKTTDILKIAAENHSTVVCATVMDCQSLARTALEMDLIIPPPMPFETFVNTHHRALGALAPTSFVFDNLDWILSRCADDISILAVSMNKPEKEND